jgi:TPR repeat protein
MYADGLGVEKNHEEAKKWFKKASEAGNMLATTWLAEQRP